MNLALYICVVKYVITIFFMLSTTVGWSQSRLSGTVRHAGEGLPGAHVQLKGSGVGAVSDRNGSFSFEAPVGTHRLRVTFLGMIPLEQEVVLVAGQEVRLDLELKADRLGLQQVVVSANREEVSRKEAAVRVEVINSKKMQQLQAAALTDGLSFSPGVRTENNCQNCGFSAVRLNGLPGAYTQILIDGRPVFSALNGVYGLDQIPASMIERTEVVRGGGSVLYGGNAVAGTVNIITRKPVANGFSIWQQSSLIEGQTPESNTQFHFDLVDNDQKAGISLYGSLRNRQWHDITGDGFSDITQLNGRSIGANAFINFSKRLQFNANAYSLSEFRRGGNGFALEPHQTDLTEQLQHRVNGLRTELSWFSANYRHKITAYNSSQFTSRHSYYGGGGRVLLPGDSLTADDLLALNAYGQAQDRSIVTGLGWQHFHSDKLQFTAGTEFWFNSIIDRMPGYNRLLDQRYQVWGNFLQAEYKPIHRWKLQGGLRYDLVQLNGHYDLSTDVFSQARQFPMLLPRLSSLYDLNAHTQLRFTWAQGYRAPQAFDEDLHIELVGGSARFVRLGDDLKPERSNSFTLALEQERSYRETGFLSAVELFYTRLQHPFLLIDAEVLPSGVQVINKRNGSGAEVYGTNVSQQIAFQGGGNLQLGMTFQRALLNAPEQVWASEDGSEAVFTEVLLRTPNWYGYANFRQPFGMKWALQANLQLTGPMQVPHVLDAATARTVLKESPAFADLALFIDRQWILAPRLRLEGSIGVQNLFNSFQRDLDTGAERDAGYIYGPTRPRTFLLSFRLVQ